MGEPVLISLLTKRGYTLIEVLIAIVIVSVGVLAIFSLQPRAWQAAGKADFMGRAGEILYRELETQQVRIMNPNNAIVDSDSTRTVNTSGQSTAIRGDAPYTIQTIVSNLEPDSSWRVTVRVTWPTSSTGIQESLIATRQERFRF
jgi:prepilin-type N-terminal cleavage/methylation domain-containing protein